MRTSSVRSVSMLIAALATLIGALPVLANDPRVEKTECDLPFPGGDPDPVTDPEGWRTRDEQNQRCALQRLTDEYTNQAMGRHFWLDVAPRSITANAFDQAAEPTRPRLTLEQLLPGGRNGDPYRYPEDWRDRLHRGQLQDFHFIASDGAKLFGRLFTPNSPPPPSGYPAVIITTGSIQGPQELYYWAAEGLAEAGYMVMTFDVQGQGHSETFPHNPDGSYDCELNPAALCPGVPFQQGYNFYQGTRDALAFLFSTPEHPYALDVPAADPANPNAADSPLNPARFNPLHELLDRSRVGLAGHSLGAGAVSVVGQADPRVKAIVGWDALNAVPTEDGDENGNGVPGEHVDENLQPVTLHAPALSMTAEYFFNPEAADPASPPDPESGLGAYNQLKSAGLDTMRVGLRSSTHLEFSYVPYLLPASRYGERVAMHYTLAWFDRYLRGDLAATDRLTALELDDSADASSIGAGVYHADSDSNIPNLIAGDCVANRLSFYQASRSSLAGLPEVTDMRARGCPQP